MPQLHVSGTPHKDLRALSPLLGNAKVRTYELAASRGDGAVTAVAAEDEEVAELEFADGLRLWVRADELDQYFPRQPGRGEGDGAIQVGTALSIDGGRRGFGQWILKTLRLFRIDPAAEAAKKLAEKIEESLHQGGGLFRCNEASFELHDPGPIPVDRPVLVLIHGTFTSTSGSFIDLWEGPQAARRSALFRHYDGNVFGFDHRTVTETPTRNAIRLAQALPAGARLHLVSHSRGGLVGELLCRCGAEGGGDPFAEADRDCFPDAPRQAEIEELSRVLAAKRLRVERFVRVAGPMRGTTLASARLDRWLSVVTNLLGAVPTVGTALFGLMSDFVLAVVRNRTDPATLPGLEAVMPESPLMSVINRPGVAVQGRLRIIAGDIEETGIWGRLKLLLPDYFYGGEHDLVVNTSSMWGGARRINADDERFFYDQGSGVNHFRYFANEASVDRLLAALTGDAAQDDGYAPGSASHPKEPIPRNVSRSTAADFARPVVFVIPGMMGSHLAQGGARVWIDPLALAGGKMATLAIDSPAVHAWGLVETTYRELIDFLAQSHDVRNFAYDWRRPMVEEARRLAEEVLEALERTKETKPPVRILAHSMGGLLARTMILERSDVWKRLCERSGARLLMLGTPNGGSMAMLRALTGRDALVRGLAALDLKHDRRELLRILAAYPGILELLPQANGRDFFAAADWDAIFAADGADPSWVKPDGAALVEAGSFRRRLAAGAIDVNRMIYVAGCAPATPVDVRIADEAPRLRFIATAAGDGRVPWETGGLPGVRTWYMEAAHGDLCRTTSAFEALKELLESGQTQRLPTQAPALRAGTQRFDLEERDVPLYPDYEDLAAAAAGGTRRMRRSAPAHKLRVRVSHGNLGFSDKPVAVGHYWGDTFTGSETYLDNELDGRLRDRQRLGLYPGAEDSCDVLLDPEGRPGGAIVVGLGRIGTLTPGRLRRYFTRAVLNYALVLAESRKSVAPQGGRAAGRIASLLIGTGPGNMALDTVLASLLAGAADANRLLADSGYAERVLIEELEFLELYEDRAIQAARALQTVAKDPQLAPFLSVDPEMRRLEGGRRRAYFEENRDWAQRLQVTEADDGTLRFVALTDRARAEGSLQVTQREVIDAMLGDSTGPGDARDSISVTLFELLVPNRLKEASRDNRAMVLVVDAGAARYPWELLRDRMSPGEEPLAVRVAMVRQLYTERFREQVAMTHLRSALVVGEPKSSFPPLPGARAEAEAVSQRLAGAGFGVERQIGTDHRQILGALYAKDYRVLHLAAHGVYEYELKDKGSGAPRRVSGMVMGDNVILTPAEIQQMRVVPEVVFINCCFLGRIENPVQAAGEKLPDALRRERSGLAANLASQLIEMGVRAVVAAGWEVNDAAAALFAQEFYDNLLAGRPFGAALLQARKRVWESSGKLNNTWGAYQAYGDPSFSLSPGGAAAGASKLGFDYVSEDELALQLDNMRADALTADPAQAQRLLEQVSGITDELPPAWQGSPRLRLALAGACGDLGAFKKAIGHYRSALAAVQCNVSLGALDQFCNTQMRWAREVAACGGEQALADAQDQLREAQQRLEQVLALAPSARRLSLLAACHLRRAALLQAQERWAALEQAARSYDEAALSAGAGDAAAPLGPRCDALRARTALRLLSPHDKAATDELIQEIRQLSADCAAVQARQDKADEVLDIVVVDCDLLLDLLSTRNGFDAEGPAAAYRRAARRAASPRALREVVESIGLLADILTREGRRDPLKKAVQALRKIEAALAGAHG